MVGNVLTIVSEAVSKWNVGGTDLFLVKLFRHYTWLPKWNWNNFTISLTFGQIEDGRVKVLWAAKKCVTKGDGQTVQSVIHIEKAFFNGIINFDANTLGICIK